MTAVLLTQPPVEEPSETAALDVEPSRPKPRSRSGWWAILPAVFLLVFLVVPVLAVVNQGIRPDGRWQVDGAVQVLVDARTWRLLWFTTWQAAASMLLTLLVGVPLAFVLARFTFPGRRLLSSLVIVPFVLPTVVVGVAFLRLMGPRGLLGVDLTGTPAALLIAHVFLNVAVVVRTVGAVLNRMDPRLDDAARVLGASRRRVFTTVTLPLVAPSVVAAAVIVFLFCFTSFGVVQVLGAGRLRTLEVEIYRSAAFDLDLVTAAVLALLQLAAVVTVLVVVARLRRGTVHRVGYLDEDVVARPPRGAGERSLVAVVAGGVAVLLAGPLMVLILGSVRAPTGWTLAYWRALFTPSGSTSFVDPLAAIVASLTTAAFATVLALVVGGAAVVVLARRSRAKWIASFDAILMLPLGTSAVTVGLGLFLALDAPPLDLRDTWLLVPIAQALVALPFVVRILLPVVQSFDPRLLEAAQVLGASPLRARWTVMRPVVQPALVVAAGFGFAISIGEFGATVFLARAGSPTLPVAIARLLSKPGDLQLGQAYAASVLLMVVVTGVVLLVDRVRVTQVGSF